MLCKSFPVAAAAFVVVMMAAAARAQTPFVVNGQTSSGPPSQVTASGSSVIDLVSNLIQSESQFSGFQDQAFNASLDYGAVNNAIQFQRNAAGTSATVTIPSTGFSRTFTGANEQEVRDKIRDFLLKDGTKQYARFLRAVNERSVLGVTDGNPQAATAILSNSAFFKFGLQRSPLDAGSLAAHPPSGSGLRFDVSGGVEDTDEGDGFFVGGSISGVTRLGGRVGLSLAAPFHYREVEGAQVYTGGIELALPIVVVAPSSGRGIVWQLTPDAVVGAAGSAEFAAGGTFFGAGVTSSLSVPLGRGTAITMGNGIYFYQGYPLDFGDYSWDTDLEQRVLKNGLKLTQNLGPVYLDVGVTYTNFLEEAAVDHYVTPTVGLGFGSGSMGLRLAYQGDSADGYRSHGGNVAIYLNY